jgi:hypothetical protein
MHKQSILVGLAALILLSGCDDRGSETAGQSIGKPENAAVVAQPAITSVLMHRSACYGRCPEYSIEVREDGSVQFNGTRFVANSGAHTAHISSAGFKKISAAIDAMKFSLLLEHYRSEKDGCTSIATDHPSVEIVVARGEMKKSVYYYYGCSGVPIAAQIIALANTIDDVTRTKQWIGE